MLTSGADGNGAGWAPGDRGFLLDRKGRRCGLFEMKRAEPAEKPKEERVYVVETQTPLINHDKVWEGRAFVVLPAGVPLCLFYWDLGKPLIDTRVEEPQDPGGGPIGTGGEAATGDASQ